MKSNLIITAYLIYLPIAIALTIYVAKNLFKNAMVFMTDIFNGKMEIASSTNRLFEIGFYLINTGFALFLLEIAVPVDNYQRMIEILSTKLGGFIIYLGIMLLLNMYLFFRGRKISRMNAAMRANHAGPIMPPPIGM